MELFSLYNILIWKHLLLHKYTPGHFGLGQAFGDYILKYTIMINIH